MSKQNTNPVSQSCKDHIRDNTKTDKCESPYLSTRPVPETLTHHVWSPTNHSVCPHQLISHVHNTRCDTYLIPDSRSTEVCDFPLMSHYRFAQADVCRPTARSTSLVLRGRRVGREKNKIKYRFARDPETEDQH